ncbi:MAG: sodium/proline symporter [Bdellovibrionota bacterium]|nr:sodium/proline symporter [Bdellovibrionota bacterium]
MSTVVISFLCFLGVFVLIGVSSSMKAQHSNSDYLLAGHDIPPWLAALSAVATNNSGYMFIGLIGFTYTSGLQSIWLMVGWILGDLIMARYVHKKLRANTEKQKLLSFGGVLSRWHGTDYRKLRFIVGIITVLFLGIYAAAQFKAGSKALHVLFDWNYNTGAIIGAVIVFAYCLSGGIRASIWTDAAQSFVMIIAMAALFIVGVQNAGGLSSLFNQLDKVSPTYLSVAPTGLPWDNGIGVFFFILGWVFAGFGVIGQPHIMIRFMTIDNTNNMKKTQIYYYSFYIAFTILTYGVGLVSRVILPETQAFDAELALPTMSQQLLPDVLIGVVLAGLFSATMSTADSQILSCSAAFTRDLMPKKRDDLLSTKLATAGVTLIALFVALYGGSNVFELVVFSWSILAASFGPLLFVYTLNKKVSERLGIAMILAGIISTLSWKAAGLSGAFYEVAPGIIAGIVTYLIGSMITTPEEASAN